AVSTSIIGGRSRRYGRTERRDWWMPGEDAGSDVLQRYTRVRGLRTTAAAAQTGEAGCRAGRKAALAPPGVSRMRAYLREGPLVIQFGDADDARGDLGTHERELDSQHSVLVRGLGLLGAHVGAELDHALERAAL